jgi:cytochrome oxidase assembly protein ShyY1
MLVAGLVAVVCVALGLWQLARLQQRRDLNASISAGLAAAPLSVDGAMPAGASPDDLRYRRARATGTYDTEREAVLYGRTQAGLAGNHLLTPLVLPDGSAIVVDRGWVPIAMDDPPVSVARPPPGTVTVTGVLLDAEGDPPGTGNDQGPEVTTLPHLDLSVLQAQLPYRIAPVYLLLQGQAPPQDDLPRPAPPPELSEGPHLSYAIQWFCFAAIALVGGVVLMRRERRDPVTRAPSPGSPEDPTRG